MADQRVALWYYRHAASGYRLCATEQEAIETAYWGMEETGEASVSGIQYADGRIVRCEEWAAYQAYADEQDRKSAQAAVERSTTQPKEPVRQVSDPFTGARVAVWSVQDDAEWLGAPHA